MPAPTPQTPRPKPAALPAGKIKPPKPLIRYNGRPMPIAATGLTTPEFAMHGTLAGHLPSGNIPGAPIALPGPGPSAQALRVQQMASRPLTLPTQLVNDTLNLGRMPATPMIGPGAQLPATMPNTLAAMPNSLVPSAGLPGPGSATRPPVTNLFQRSLPPGTIRPDSVFGPGVLSPPLATGGAGFGGRPPGGPVYGPPIPGMPGGTGPGAAGAGAGAGGAGVSPAGPAGGAAAAGGLKGAFAKYGMHGWGPTSAKIAGMGGGGKLAGMAGKSLKGGFLPGLAIGLGGGALENSLRESGNNKMGSLVEDIWQTGAAGSLAGPVGAAVGAGAGAITGLANPLINHMRGGLGMDPTDDSIMDVVADFPGVGIVGSLFGGQSGESQEPMKVKNADTVGAWMNEFDLPPSAREAVSADYHAMLDEALMYNKMGIDPMTGQPYEDGKPLADEIITDYVATQVITSLPARRAEAEEQDLALQRQLAYQAMIGPFIQPMTDKYNALADLAVNSTMANMSTLPPELQGPMLQIANANAMQYRTDALNTERQLRALPATEALNAYTATNAQLAQQQQAQLLSQLTAGGATGTNPMQAIDDQQLAAMLAGQ